MKLKKLLDNLRGIIKPTQNNQKCCDVTCTEVEMYNNNFTEPEEPEEPKLCGDSFVAPHSGTTSMFCDLDEDMLLHTQPIFKITKSKNKAQKQSGKNQTQNTHMSMMLPPKTLAHLEEEFNQPIPGKTASYKRKHRASVKFRQSRRLSRVFTDVFHDQENVIRETLTLTVVLSNDLYRRHFKEFCKLEKNSENIDFWEVVSAYENMTKYEEDKDTKKSLAQQIVKEFVLSESPRAININHTVITQIQQEMAEADALDQPLSHTLFRTVKKFIEDVMIDPYRRFKFSPQFEHVVAAHMANSPSLDNLMNRMMQS